MKSRLGKFCKEHSIKYSIVVCKENSVPKSISDFFESKIIGGFKRVISFVNRYTKASNQRIPITESLLENYYVDEQLTHLLHTANYLKMEYLNRKKSVPPVPQTSSDGDQFDKFLLEKMTLSLKCAINKPLADRCNLQLQACNTKLISMNFEAEVIKSVSSGVLADIKQFRPDREPDTTQQGDPTTRSKRNRRRQKQEEEETVETREESKKLVTSFKNDIKEVISQAERDVGNFGRLLQKLLFEINNYVKKSCFSEEQKRCSIAEVTRDIRRQILQYVIRLLSYFSCNESFNVFLV